KAKLGSAGAQSMREFADQHGIDVDICGKLVVATEPRQVPALLTLLDRGHANGVPVRLISPDQAAEYEPHVSCVAALHVASTGIVDYRGVCAALAEQIRERGGDIVFDSEIVGINGSFEQVVITTTTAEVFADQFVNCAGLHADRLARLAGLQPAVRIIPFRGEYYELTGAAEHFVHGLIYPVPDPT